ncbi:unnamed protein product [Prorocentrum cordatum]|uniref:Uncharacterized protein n=1 Tax=Prorocentrum cordatum TaxID=2364126 RepID=A0ABN9WW33_9DINO|nr:unnamed protein product [Polarella glacialis]
MRLMEKTIALLEVIEEDKARDEYPLFKHILDFAKQNGHEDKVPLEKSAEGEDPSAANVVPAMSTGAKAFVAQLLKLYCESSNARRLLQKHQGQSVKELFGKDSTLDMQRAGLFQLMRDELQSPKLKKTAKQVMMKMKEEEKGAAGMAEFLNMFTVGKKLGELQIQTGLEEFNVDEDRPNDPEREKYQWDVNVEPLERDLEMCACCGSEIAQRCRDSETKSTDLQWCVSNHFQDMRIEDVMALLQVLFQVLEGAQRVDKTCC